MELTEADKQKLRRAFSVKTHISGNLLTFIGLEEVKDAFPAEWKRNRERILGTARQILAQFTDREADIILARGDAGFVVLFARLGRQEALLRAAMIKAEIMRRFTGEEMLDALDVQVHAMELDSGTVMEGRLGDLLTRIHAEAAAPVDSEADSPSQRVLRASQSAIGVSPEALEAMEQPFGFDLDALDFAFLPLLYVKRGVFSVFACRPVRYSATGEILAGYNVLPRDTDPGLVAALDGMTLMRVRHGLVDMAVRKRKAVVVAPVAYETMAARGPATEYLALLQKVPPDLRDYLVITLARCPTGIPEGRLAEILNPLKRASRAVFVRLESARDSLPAIRGAGAFGVGYNIAYAAGDMAGPTYLPRLIASARKLGLQTFVEGVNTPELLQRCRDTGPDYAAGRALAEMSDYVGPITEIRAA